MKNTMKTLSVLAMTALAANAQTISVTGFNAGVPASAPATAPTAAQLALLTDGDISHDAGTSLAVAPADDSITGLDHAYTISFGGAVLDISTFELHSDFRALDAYVTLGDIEFFDAAGVSLADFTDIVFDAPTGTSSANGNWFDEASSTVVNTAVSGASSAVFTVQNVNALTGTNADGSYQLREFTFTAVPEPSSTALLGLGGLALLARRRRA